MNKNYKILAIITLAAVVYFGLKFYSRSNSGAVVEDLLSNARESFGGQIRIFEQSALEVKLDSLISKNDYVNALQIIDTANIMEETRLNYKGEIYLMQGKIRESINFFDQAVILGGTYSNAFANRAKAYTEIGLFDSAIIDYKTITLFNYDYYRPLAETYEKMKQMDSAIKYYKIFLGHYPDSLSIKNRIVNLENGG